MSKHTPGPWKHGARLSGSENHRGYRICSHHEGYFLAEVSPLDADGVEGGANARLIAAAPEMYEALKDAVCALEVCGRDFDYVMDKARAILAKVEGR